MSSSMASSFASSSSSSDIAGGSCRPPVHRRAWRLRGWLCAGAGAGSRRPTSRAVRLGLRLRGR
eukprot:scaffold122510_cov42-Phaeocystis_antarctica.AAC.1